MSANALSPELQKRLERSQRDELDGALIYAKMAKREKDPKNREILKRMAGDESEHAALWARVLGKKLAPHSFKVALFSFIGRVMGFTFLIKYMQNGEAMTAAMYDSLKAEVPEAADALADEVRHEAELTDMLDEERLHYVGSMVLGLNDALVELTGTIAGLTFSLANTRVVALSGIITGISATLSMAASNYLAERAAGNQNAMKSSVYTGVAYLITVALLVLPYLLFPSNMYGAALAVMLATVVAVIAFFNFYISVARSEKFMSRFGEMAIISLSVAVLAFVIGLLAKNLLGIDVG